MGKAKKKNKKSEFDDFFDKPKDSGGWMTGVSAMALDDAPAAAAADEPAAGGAAPSKAGSSAAMDTTEGPEAQRASGLGVKHAAMKRGSRTKAQKDRKGKKVEKALARADKMVVRVGTKVTLKHKKLGLKNIY